YTTFLRLKTAPQVSYNAHNNCHVNSIHFNGWFKGKVATLLNPYPAVRNTKLRSLSIILSSSKQLPKRRLMTDTNDYTDDRQKRLDRASLLTLVILTVSEICLCSPAVTGVRG
ncbi:hypothetical protein BaRGS_00008074, partial [Batillaria attramentaria]